MMTVPPPVNLDDGQLLGDYWFWDQATSLDDYQRKVAHRIEPIEDEE